MWGHLVVWITTISLSVYLHFDHCQPALLHFQSIWHPFKMAMTTFSDSLQLSHSFDFNFDHRSIEISLVGTFSDFHLLEIHAMTSEVLRVENMCNTRARRIFLRIFRRIFRNNDFPLRKLINCENQWLNAFDMYILKIEINYGVSPIASALRYVAGKWIVHDINANEIAFSICF